MLAIIYIFAAIMFGDIVSRRFVVYNSLIHRLSSSFLIGIVICACLSYLLTVAFSWSERPLLLANLVFFTLVPCICLLLHKLTSPIDDVFSGIGTNTRPPGSAKWDVAVYSACFIVGYLLLYSMLKYQDGNIMFTLGTWSDFGANISLSQSFALGNNYPSEHPFFPGEPLRYHFLFWFLSANLAFLGLNIVTAVNLLSILSLMAMLALMALFAEKLFGSRAVGRISLLFFFLASSSLSYIPFLFARESISDVFTAILARRSPLPSGFPYYSDDWGSLSIISFANQRQLLAACGIALFVLIYLVGFYRRRGAMPLTDHEQERSIYDERLRSEIPAMVFCGVLLGLLPYFNTAVFLSISAVIGGLFLLFPHRRTLAVLIIAEIAVALPQLLIIRMGNTVSMGQYYLNWGYIVSEPTISKLIEYLGWTFGFKWIALMIAVATVASAYRRFMLALMLPLIIAFSFQLSVTVINNHKLINVWGVLIASFVAYGIWKLGRRGSLRRILAAALTVLIVFGAIIDLFPIYNDGFVSTPHPDDRLSQWLLSETRPNDVFLSEMYLTHPILFTGRRVYYGNTLYAWTAGYGGLGDRDKAYKAMLKTNDPMQLSTALRSNNIQYIAVDNGFRNNENSKHLDENMLRANFPLVFDDTEKRYGELRIYKVPN